jgi:hypothetical protein
MTIMELIQIFPIVTRYEAEVDGRIEPHEEWAIGAIREERTKLLSDSDWKVLPDSPITNIAEWYEYRQKLRDFPEVVLTNNFINTPWPEAPLDR